MKKNPAASGKIIRVCGPRTAVSTTTGPRFARDEGTPAGEKTRPENGVSA